MGKYLFFDIDGTLVNKKAIKEIKQTCKNSYKAFKCIKAPISIIKDVNDMGFNDIIASTGSFGNKYILENYINQMPGIREFFNIDIFSRDTDSYINGEIIRKGCTKDDAIKKDLAYYTADMKDSIAFGDSKKDYQMIETVSYGVVLHLAFDKLKAIADNTFDKSNNDRIYTNINNLNWR